MKMKHARIKIYRPEHKTDAYKGMEGKKITWMCSFRVKPFQEADNDNYVIYRCPLMPSDIKQDSIINDFALGCVYFINASPLWSRDAIFICIYLQSSCLRFSKRLVLIRYDTNSNLNNTNKSYWPFVFSYLFPFFWLSMVCEESGPCDGGMTLCFFCTAMVGIEPGIPMVSVKTPLLSLLLLSMSISRCLRVLALQMHCARNCPLHQLLVHLCRTNQYKKRMNTKHPVMSQSSWLN